MIVYPGVPGNLRWFAESRFGMFVHFGLYSLLGRGEWVMYNEDISRSEYRKLAAKFNPDKFSGDEWVELAKQAGARYITVTAKHHDGFCLFDSSLTDYKITNTPFGRDLIGELVDACHRHDMRIVFYYSQPDWYHPNFVHNPGAFKDLTNPPPSDKPDWGKYVRYFHGQVRELCTKYGRIDGIWFDGSHKTEEEWRGKELYDMIKELQPNAVVNDRARWGDFFTPERSLPDDLTGYMIEACESISPTSWGYQDDTAAFSVPHLLKNLVRMAAASGNYLLNVGPAPDGTIPEDQATVMRAIGDWLARNGESIYATQAGPKLTDSTIRCTRRGNTLYLHCLEWPAVNRIPLPTVVPEGVKEAVLVTTGAALEVVETADGSELRGLPAIPPDPLVNVIRVEFYRAPKLFSAGPLKVVEPMVVTVPSYAPTRLLPEKAEFEGLGVKGAKLRVRRNAAGGQFISGWMVPDHAAHWNVNVERAGRYSITAIVGAPATHAGAVIRVVAGDAELTFTAPDTGTLDAVKTVPVGTVELPAGTGRITVRPEKLKWGYLSADIAELVLTPVA